MTLQASAPSPPVILTANRLHDGTVVWMVSDYSWHEDRIAAAEFTADLALIARRHANADVVAQKIISLYEISVDGIADTSAREMIRAARGPSITPPPDYIRSSD